VVFIVLTAAIATVTVIDFIKNIMAGAYKEGYYTDDFAGAEEADIAAFRARQAALGKGEGSEESIDEEAGGEDSGDGGEDAEDGDGQ
jgi:hypothetical protein